MLGIACPQCGKRYKVKPEVQGKQVRCSGCKSEFTARSAPCRMELALLNPDARLVELARTGSLSELGFFLNHMFTMIQVDDTGGYIPMTVEVTVDNRSVPGLVLFTSSDAARVFVDMHPEMLDESGSLPGFEMQGFNLVKNTPKKVALLFNPGSKDSTVLMPEDWEPLRKAQVKFEKEPHLKAAIPEPHPEADQQSQLSDTAANIRNQSFAYLDYLGFQAARWLPAPDPSRQLRPIREIAGRLAALAGVFAWASAPPEVLSNKAIGDYFKKSSLGKYLTKDEAAIVTTSRQKATEEHQHSVGWRLENMWPLAWVLGFEPEPDVDGAQIDSSVSMAIVMEYLEQLSISLDALVEKSQLRSAMEVIAKEDLFYCAHNAVRSAQLGKATVPTGFDPVGNGGVIHERRHSLTWCLSPGVPWQETDLST